MKGRRKSLMNYDSVMCPLPGHPRFVRVATFPARAAFAAVLVCFAAALLAAPAAAQTISFGKSTLQGTALTIAVAK